MRTARSILTVASLLVPALFCSEAFAFDFIPLGNGQLADGKWAEAYTVVLDPGELPLFHYHPGDLTIIVNSGEITHVVACGVSKTYHAGESFIIPAGLVHEELNNGSTPDNVTVFGVMPSCAGNYNDAIFVDEPACKGRGEHHGVFVRGPYCGARHDD
jgi:quercetin dioxygenase-like cupin family protein